VHKSFGDVHVLTDVDLLVRSGERVGIIGLNGAGKTTLFQVVTGIYAPSAGQIHIGGHDATGLSPNRRNALGLARTFQVTMLYPRLTAGQNLALALLGRRFRRYRFTMWRPLTRMPDLRRRIDELLEGVGLRNVRDVEVRHLSYGHQRQVEVALALASDPALILLDEPTAGLSQAESPAMIRLLRSLPAELTILVVEHNLELIFEVVQRVVVLHEGRVIMDGPADEVRGDPEVRRLYLGSRAGPGGGGDTGSPHDTAPAHEPGRG
jgi:ABC-type branched-subunit amino acid transport system ATPase component